MTAENTTDKQLEQEEKVEVQLVEQAEAELAEKPVARAAESKDEVTASKDEVKASKDEAKASKDEAKASKDEAKASKDEVKASKDEVKVSKDEVKVSKDEVTASKDEVTASKDEVTASKDEVKVSKDDVKASNDDAEIANDDAARKIVPKPIITVPVVELEGFDKLGLSAAVYKCLKDVGYETPSPIQAETIPLILEGRDVLGQAQTGTGKTAAFALPLLSKIDLKKTIPQVLVLAPTRELAIQVAEAFQRYAHHMRGFAVLPIYGGAGYEGQFRQLKRGVHVVVGTPGRIMDHMRRGSLDLSGLTALVLDEADEMLRMGFIDDVKWILEQTPDSRQTALFSATLPSVIQRIAAKHLRNPAVVSIKVRTATAETIRQRCWVVSGINKLDALTRLLETENFEAMIVFVRTRNATEELAEKLAARGFATAALNGDIPQARRERTIEQLKKGNIDILVATDVAARGLDVERISHVVNYDVPHDTEAYIHRIGRTGRAGRSGQAVLFVAPRERRLLHAIEKATKQPVEMMTMPTSGEVNSQRINRFKQKITDALSSAKLDFFQKLIEEYNEEQGTNVEEIAAALASMVQGDQPLLMPDDPKPRAPRSEPRYNDDEPRSHKFSKGGDDSNDDVNMERFRVDVGHVHGVKPGNLVGAIANEVGIDSRYIGRINIGNDSSTVDLPAGIPPDVLAALKKVWVSGQQLKMARIEEIAEPYGRKKRFKPAPAAKRGGLKKKKY